MRAKECDAYAAHSIIQNFVRPHGAGNAAFAVLPKAKKRERNAVKRVGSYMSPGRGAVPVIPGMYDDRTSSSKRHRTCLSVPRNNGYGGAAGLRTVKPRVASNASSYISLKQATTIGCSLGTIRTVSKLLSSPQ